ncbi:uncharacterized protein [Pempheris klunzingeri]|uniref:uncharacterized protein n=1 Tax=Pempheris klunzingeri TaxID=3127111 RepID=UPI00397EB552
MGKLSLKDEVRILTICALMLMYSAAEQEYFPQTTDLTWNEARNHCQVCYKDLVTLTPENIRNITLKLTSDHWVGLRKNFTSNSSMSWSHWANGDPLTFQNWYPGWPVFKSSIPKRYCCSCSCTCSAETTPWMPTSTRSTDFTTQNVTDISSFSDAYQNMTSIIASGQPTTQNVTPVIASGQPTTQNMASFIASGQPTTQNVTPVIASGQPTTQNMASFIASGQPTTQNVTPVITSGQPTTQNMTSIITSGQPTTQNVTPAITSGQPTTQNVTPVIASGQPTTQNVTSLIASGQPTTQNVTPVIASGQPTTQNMTSIITSGQPTTQNMTSIIASGQPTTQNVTPVIASGQPTTQNMASFIASGQPTTQNVTPVIASGQPTTQNMTSLIASGQPTTQNVTPVITSGQPTTQMTRSREWRDTSTQSTPVFTTARGDVIAECVQSPMLPPEVPETHENYIEDSCVAMLRFGAWVEKNCSELLPSICYDDRFSGKVIMTQVTSVSANITWLPGPNNTSHYRVVVNKTVEENVTDLTYGLVGLTAGAHYSVQVFPVKCMRDLNPQEISFYTTPNKVENLTVTNVTENMISLRWNKPDGSVDFYLVDVQGVESKIKTESKEIDDLIPGRLYTISVLSGVGESTRSEESNITRYTKPGKVSNLIVSNNTKDTLLLTWTPPTGYTTGYWVEAMNNSNEYVFVDR